MFIEIALSTLLVAVLILGYMIINELKSVRFNSKGIENHLEKVVLDGIAHLSEEIRQHRRKLEEIQHLIEEQRHRLEDIWHLNDAHSHQLGDIQLLNEGQMHLLNNVLHLNEEQRRRLDEIRYLNEESRRRLNVLSDFYGIND